MTKRKAVYFVVGKPIPADANVIIVQLSGKILRRIAAVSTGDETVDQTIARLAKALTIGQASRNDNS